MTDDCYKKMETICQQMQDELAQSFGNKVLDQPTYILLSSMVENIYKRFVISFIAHIQEQEKNV